MTLPPASVDMSRDDHPIRDDIDHAGTDRCVCPWCGYEDRDSWELGASDDDHDCPQCERKFAYDTEVSRTFTSTRILAPRRGE